MITPATYLQLAATAWGDALSRDMLISGESGRIQARPIVTSDALYAGIVALHLCCNRHGCSDQDIPVNVLPVIHTRVANGHAMGDRDRCLIALRRFVAKERLTVAIFAPYIDRLDP